MARLARVVIPGIAHHVTQRGTRSQDIFFTEADRRAYLELVRECAHNYGVKVICWCLMTNHVHFAVVPDTEGSLAKCFGTAHRGYSRMIDFRNDRRGFLFQGRFGSSPMDPVHTYHTPRYILRNPVRAGIARVPWRGGTSGRARRIMWARRGSIRWRPSTARSRRWWPTGRRFSHRPRRIWLCLIAGMKTRTPGGHRARRPVRVGRR